MDDYYGKNLFGETVNIGFGDALEVEEQPTWNKDNQFNIYALTDAIAARNKREAWVVYERALATGMVADEIFWRVMWGVKSLLLASKCASAEEAGLNPFVYKKMKESLKNWESGEVEKLSEKLVVGYHNARRGIGEIETLIEKTVLSL